MTHRVLFVSLVLFAAVGPPARADLVFVRGREKPVNGDVKSEDAKAVVVTVKDAKKKSVDESIPAMDVLDIHYDSLGPAELRLGSGAYGLAKKEDKEAHETADPVKRKASLAKAIENYSETLKKMNANVLARRNIEYRLAILTNMQAATENLGTEKALAKLLDFRKRFPTSWQINHVMPLVAQLQIAGGDGAAAEETFKEMSEMETLPADVRRDAELMIVQVLIRGGKAEQAQKKLDALSAKAGKSPAFASRIEMARAEVLISQKKIDQAVKLLQQVVKENTDKTVKAQAHNTLGECLFKANRYNEALWEFLWVDAVFNQDKSQHAKALYFLWKSFEQLGDADRAQECRQQLLTDRLLAGTEYQRKAAAEAK
jgi:tetratricopeptide (TPR) repeat protein